MPDFSSCHGALGPFKVSAHPGKSEGHGTAETGQIVCLTTAWDAGNFWGVSVCEDLHIQPPSLRKGANLADPLLG
jgi:hypothetical protein